jgi:hypothetical protein
VTKAPHQIAPSIILVVQGITVIMVRLLIALWRHPLDNLENYALLDLYALTQLERDKLSVPYVRLTTTVQLELVIIN